MGPAEIAIVLACADILKKAPMDFQNRWMDYKVGIKQVAMEDMRNKGIIIPI
jgi:hypothetical protein